VSLMPKQPPPPADATPPAEHVVDTPSGTEG